MTFRKPAVSAAALIAVLAFPAGAQAAEPTPHPAAAEPACQGWMKTEAKSYLIMSSGSFEKTRQWVPQDTCLIKIDENRFAPGWFVNRYSHWELATENTPGAVYKQFVYAIEREATGGYVLSHVLDRADLRDVAENVDCDGRVTADLAHSWKADTRVWGEPNRQMTDWFRTWNTVEGFSDQGTRWRKDQCVKLTGSVSDWEGHTYYETATSAASGVHRDWIRDDDVQLNRK